MSKIERICCLVSHIGGYLMIVDQILDGLAAKKYHGDCATGSVECHYWKLAIFFLFLPTFFSIIWFSVLGQLLAMCKLQRYR